MRKAMQKAVGEFISSDPMSSLLLVDIGVWAFRDLLREYPSRVKNIGIFEPGTVGIAAGLSLLGITPTIYGISPFIVQRSLEQLKLDFVYQKTGGNMTDHCNKNEAEIEFGKAKLIKSGKKGTVAVWAEMLDAVVESCRDIDVNILYYTSAVPFDYAALQECTDSKLVLCHPFYKGTFSDDVQKTFGGTVEICEIAVPREVLRNYGTKAEKDMALELTPSGIKSKIDNFLK